MSGDVVYRDRCQLWGLLMRLASFRREKRAGWLFIIGTGCTGILVLNMLDINSRMMNFNIQDSFVHNFTQIIGGINISCSFFIFGARIWVWVWQLNRSFPQCCTLQPTKQHYSTKQHQTAPNFIIDCPLNMLLQGSLCWRDALHIVPLC